MSQKNIALLDGGVGQEINQRALLAESHPQWSVKVMLDSPEIVTQVHMAFLQAGCRVVTLNNYAATPTRMRKFGMSSDLGNAHALAIACAQEAIVNSDFARAQVNIAGCLPPLAASYVTAVAPSYDKAYAEYCQLIEQQAESVDVFLVETMSNIEELHAALDALKHFNQRIYVAMTLRDDGSNCLRSGQPLSGALNLLQEYQADAAMINCCYPEAIDSAMPLLSASSLQFGAYANGFKSVESLTPGSTVDGLEHRPELTPDCYADYVSDWVKQGASIVGGCCEISPKHMRCLHDRLVDYGYSVTALF